MRAEERSAPGRGEEPAARDRIGLIGDPVAHSVSPAMHRAAFAAMGLPLDYIAIRVTPSDLTEAFPGLRRGHVGLNVTAPLKEAILPLLDDVSTDAARARSVNTVVISPDGTARGSSTDGAGFLAALDRASVSRSERAVILGTGGAARAVAAALLARGAFVTVCGRNAENGRRAQADAFVPPECGPLSRALGEADLLVNATPVGSWPGRDACPLPTGVALPKHVAVFDLVYRPRRTALLRLAERTGCRTVQGVEMLIEQGARSLLAWTGAEPPIGVMRTAAYRELAEGSAS